MKDDPHVEQLDRLGQPDQPDNLDRILVEEGALLQSSGFAASVMDAIQLQSVAPAPIPFPWKLALPGIAALLFGLAVVCRFAIKAIGSIDQNSATGANIDWPVWLNLNSTSEFGVLLRTQGGPVLLALAVSWLCVLLCRRLAGERSAR
jgi:hypothetical protein